MDYLYKMDPDEKIHGGDKRSWFNFYKKDREGMVFMPCKDDRPKTGDVIWFAFNDDVVASTVLTGVVQDPTDSTTYELQYDGAAVTTVPPSAYDSLRPHVPALTVVRL